MKGATNRDTAYEITEDGSRVSARLVAQRRELLMTPTKDMVELDRQLRSLALSLGLLTGVYDHGHACSHEEWARAAALRSDGRRLAAELGPWSQLTDARIVECGRSGQIRAASTRRKSSPR